MAGTSQGRSFAVLLGAGASVEAGAPTAAELTRLFADFSRHFGDEDAVRIENTFRRIQVALGDHTAAAAGSVDFEAVLGVLTDLSAGQMPQTLGVAASSSTLLPQGLAPDKLRDDLARQLATLRELLDVDPRRTEYLAPILDLRTPRRPLDVFTLNFDLSFESMLRRHGVRFRDGFADLKSARGYAVWDASSFDGGTPSVKLHKLHGSLDWAILQSGPRPGDGARLGAMDDYLRGFPVLARTNEFRSAQLLPPASKNRAAMALNLGTRKELMYSTTPFTELFHRFYESLIQVDVLLIAGYSFRDERVNQLLEECVVLRRGSLRLLVVDPSVFRVADNLSTLWQFYRDGVAFFVDSSFGEFLRSRSLRRSIERRLDRTPAASVVQWGTSFYEPSLAVSDRRDVWIITDWWRSLGSLYDALAIREEKLSLYTTEELTLYRDEALVHITRMVQILADIQLGFDSIMQCMEFGPYFGKAHHESIRRSAQPVGTLAPETELKSAQEQLSQWTGYAIAKYRNATDEFLRGIADSNYGKGLAPDNFSMAEMVSRDALKGVREGSFAVDSFAQAMGLENPGLFPQRTEVTA